MKWPPTHDSELHEALISVLERGVLSDGPEVQALEAEFSTILGLQHSVALSSGTSAITAALLASGVKAGDRVVVPAFTFSGSVLPVIHIGAEPVFSDIDPLTFCLDPHNAAEIARRVNASAILLVHLHGFPVAVPPELRMELDASGIRIIEDACQAPGARLPASCQVALGNQGAAAAFSLNEKKQIFSGEGGILTTTSLDLARRACRLRRYGEPVEQNDASWRSYESIEIGYNWKLSELSAAIARVSLRRLEERCLLANENAATLTTALHGTRLHAPHPGGGRHAWHKYRVYCGAKDRNRLLERLRTDGIPVSLWQTRILPEMPAFSRWASAFGQSGYPHARDTLESTIVIGDEVDTLYGSPSSEVALWAEKLRRTCR